MITELQFQYAPTEGDIALGSAMLRFKSLVEHMVKVDPYDTMGRWSQIKVSNQAGIELLMQRSADVPDAKKFATAKQMVEMCEKRGF